MREKKGKWGDTVHTPSVTHPFLVGVVSTEEVPAFLLSVVWCNFSCTSM